MGCEGSSGDFNENDETIDRRNVKLRAVYQEYNLHYDALDRDVTSTVYFRVSKNGIYVKLDNSDSIKVSVENAVDSTRRTLKEKKKQVYFGSKNVPYYYGTTKITSETNNLITWEWYDSDTDQTIKTETNLKHPKVKRISHDRNNVLDTEAGEDFTVVLKEKLNSKQTFRIIITNPNNEDASDLVFKFKAEDSADKKTFTVTADEIREASATATTIVTKKSKKKYKNLYLKVRTKKKVPVLASGRQTYNLRLKMSESKVVHNETKKEGVVHTSISFVKDELDINF